MRPGEIHLARFPFGDVPRMKLRPVLSLSGPVGPVPEVLVAYISSVIPSTPLPSDLILDPSSPEHQSTGLKTASTLRLHKLATIHCSSLMRRLGALEVAPHREVRARLQNFLAPLTTTTIAPWLSVRGSRRALDFYKSAFNATEVYLLDGGPKGIVARLSINGAEFWISDESPEHGNPSPETAGGVSVRMILTVDDPDAVFNQAIKAGATQIYPVSEGHGWRVGRIVDPFGHHWEIGRPL